MSEEMLTLDDLAKLKKQREEEKSKLPYAGLRTACDISYVILGTLMGGTFGIGTICSVLLTGSMVSKIIKIIEKSITGDKYEDGKVVGEI